MWDTSLPESHVGSYSLPLAQEWAANLTLSLSSGLYAPLVPTWLEGIDLANPVSTSLKWATEANAFVCSHVLPEGVDGVREKELAGGEYEEKGWEVVQVQIARAGVR